MSEFDFKPMTCKKCGQQISYCPDGKLKWAECRCDRAKSRRDRVAKTVDPEFLNPDQTLKLMNSWNPPLFGQPSAFKEMVRAQRTILIGKLNEFAFRQVDDARAMTRSINGRLNFFLRGPQGTGRGLVAANIKAMAALGDFSATPRAEDCAWAKFEVFKEATSKATALGSAGTEASAGIYWYYQDVDLMIVEGVRTETRLDFRGDTVRHKSAGAQSIDLLMAQRANRRRGSMVITSHDFIGQIRETLGDSFLDEMCSQRTMIALLLSPVEVDLVHGHLIKAYQEYRMSVGKLRNKESATDRKRLTDRAASKEDGALMREALMFGAALGEWCPPGPRIIDMARQLVENGEVGKEAADQFRMFLEEEGNGGRLFDDDRRLALGRAISSCSFLKGSLVDREVDELVKIVRMSINPDRLRKSEELAATIIKEMSEV